MNTQTWTERRSKLRAHVSDGALLLPGNAEAPRNYLANVYPFRQDSHFLYYVGADQPDLVAMILPDGDAWLFGPEEDPDDLVWHGPHPSLQDHAERAGISKVGTLHDLETKIGKLRQAGTPLHYLAPYRAERTLQLARWLDLPPKAVAEGASVPMTQAVVAQRSQKSPDEVAEIEEALSISKQMYEAAYPLIRPGRREYEIAGAMQGVALAHDRAQSFNPIVSIRGEVLHNVHYQNTLAAGDLLLIDSGTESPHYYASDITRTFPVSGRFEPRQRAIYEAVLEAQLAAIAAASPERTNRDIHLIAAETMTAGLIEAGLMRGDPKTAVEAGAHALFFVHGLGHMLGVDVHDMEDLGDAVGYRTGEPRSDQFGLNFLRMARRLEPGFVVTVEPGLYFIPALIDRWRAEARHAEFIDYDAVEAYRGFGGIRIEDDLLITDSGARVLGPPIPKSVAEVEATLRD